MLNPSVDLARILVVEDDPLFSEVLKERLVKDGYNVTTCDTGRDAIDILRHHTFEIALLDVGLPDMSGYEIIEAMDFQTESPLFFAMTGNGTLDSALEAIRQRVYNFLIKPFDLIVLQQEIKNAIHHKQLMADRLEFKRALGESEKCLEDLIDSSMAGIGVFHNQQIVYSNSEFRKIFQDYSGSFGDEFYSFIHPDDVLRTKEVYNRFATGELKNVDLDFRFYPSGNLDDQSDRRWLHGRVKRFNFQGKKALLSNVIDITNTKEIERQLIIKNKMYSLGQVAAGVAHEIRNPLTGINGYLYALDTLCKQDFSEGNGQQKMMKEIIDQIQDASGIIESVIKRVMDFSKPGSPKMKLTDINMSIKSAISLSTMGMRRSKIKIETSLADNLPRFYVDSGLIEQVLVNLLNNAAQAMQAKDGLKIVRVESFSKDNTLTIIVSDSGPGIPLGSRDRIFEPFFSTKEDGAGIGLNIVQRIIADHNGTIGFSESNWGGAKFRIDLPIERRIYPRS